MTNTTPTEQESTQLASHMLDMGVKARAAATRLRTASAAQRNLALLTAADHIDRDTQEILSTNAKDMDAARARDLSPAMLDRLALTPERVGAIADAVRAIATLPDSLGETIWTTTRPNGLVIDRVRVPLGVIGIIYESRPNVTADAGALCLKAGNGVILRGGSESFHSSRALHACLGAGLKAADLPLDAIQYVGTTDRSAVHHLLSGLDGNVDLIVPRGGKSLVRVVEQEARVPVLSHLDGICHIYIDQYADADMAKDIVVNAKMRRTGICGALETLLVHEEVIATHLPPIIDALAALDCELRGDTGICAVDGRIKSASVTDWDTEYLDAELSIAAVPTLEAAMAHIARHGSGHTESIITDDQENAQAFLAGVDSAIVMHNASTQFADGGEFGLGAEIGIATGRLHARGPVGVEGLTTYKYRVRGNGQTRP